MKSLITLRLAIACVFSLLIMTGNVFAGGISQSQLQSDATFHLRTLIVDYNTTTTTKTLLRYDAGKIYVINGDSADDAVTFQLPTGSDYVIGVPFTFIDNNATAGADLKIQAATNDTINGGTAGKIYNCTGDAVKQHCTLVCTKNASDVYDWVVIAENGTWANDNS